MTHYVCVVRIKHTEWPMYEN